MGGQAKHIPEGFHTLTPYLVCEGVGRLLEFVRNAFGAVETFRMAREDGSIAHTSVRIGDSMVEMGEPAGEYKAMVTGVHLYVPNVDETYQQAVSAGGASLEGPQDMAYGDREAGVKDPSGNDWYVATHKGTKHFAPAGFRSVTVYLSVKDAAALLAFLEKAFDAEVVSKDEGAGGVIAHATVRIGDSVLECSEAHGQWGPRPVAIHVYVPDVDAVYRAAIAAGATSMGEPKDQFYGERGGQVIDACGNHWYIATHQETLSEAEVQRRAAQSQAAG
jgi:uncharacterized glyoxalase superfamily protein PhnB